MRLFEFHISCWSTKLKRTRWPILWPDANTFALSQNTQLLCRQPFSPQRAYPALQRSYLSKCWHQSAATNVSFPKQANWPHMLVHKDFGWSKFAIQDRCIIYPKRVNTIFFHCLSCCQSIYFERSTQPVNPRKWIWKCSSQAMFIEIGAFFT